MLDKIEIVKPTEIEKRSMVSDPELYGENPDKPMSDRCNYCIREFMEFGR